MWWPCRMSHNFSRDSVTFKRMNMTCSRWYFCFSIHASCFLACQCHFLLYYFIRLIILTCYYTTIIVYSTNYYINIYPICPGLQYAMIDVKRDCWIVSRLPGQTNSEEWKNSWRRLPMGRQVDRSMSVYEAQGLEVQWRSAISEKIWKYWLIAMLSGS